MLSSTIMILRKLTRRFSFAFGHFGFCLDADVGGKSTRGVELTAVENNSILLDTLSYGPKDAENALAYQNRGSARNQTGDWNGAIADFERVVTINPKWVDAYNGRGLAHYYKGELD